MEHALLNYDDLPAAERAEADAYLAEHPEAEVVRAEGRALRALLGDAARAGADVPDAEALALYLAARHAGRHPLPPDLAALGERIEAAFAEHPELERRYAMMQDRLKTLTADAESPLAQFERLTGRLPDQSGSARHDTPQTQPASAPPHPSPSHHERSRSWRTSVSDRAAAPLLRRVTLPRIALAASLLAVLLYGGLFVASQSSETRLERLASLGEVPAQFEGLRLRGSGGSVDPVTDRYAEALETLHDARSTTLGLFPRYDPDGLDRTLSLLEEATSIGASDGPITLEAWFLTGRIHLYRGDVAGAREAFQTVVDRRGPSAPYAQRLLDELPPIGAPE